MTQLQGLLFSAALIVSLAASNTHAALLDFNSLGNGQKISGFELSPLVSISSTGPNLGPAAFDSSDSGPNSTGGDQDLLVNQGNVLILQNTDFPDDSGDFFDVPNDDEDGGTIEFDFVTGVTMTSIDLVDIDNSAAVTVQLEDGNGLTRTYLVPDFWTGEIPGTVGYATLDLTTLSNQPAISTGGDATASEQPGFDADNVIVMIVEFMGSSALNNVVFVPEPNSAGLLLFALIGILPCCRRSKNSL